MGSAATAIKPKKKKNKLSKVGKFARDYIEDAVEENETLAAVIGALSKAEYHSFLEEMAVMCQDYGQALYGDDDEDDEYLNG
jgi:hypothetical protein